MVAGKINSLDDKIIDASVYIIIVLVIIIVAFPLLAVISMSVTPQAELLKNGGFVLLPRSFSMEGYHILLSKSDFPNALKVNVILTLIGTAVNIILSTLTAYPLSRKNLPGRNWILLLMVFTMFFGGGMIPTYLIVKNLGLLNSFWAMILPGAISTYNMLLMKSFFEGLPQDLFESARIDGAAELRVLLVIVLPLSLPILMTVGLFYMVGHWNSFFAAIFYITDRKLYPLQVFLREMLSAVASNEQMEVNPESMIPTQTLRMCSVVVSTLPIVIVYPFIQKYFTKGVLLGSVKG
jgi:putative aldouronate transport system permease protein